MRQLRLVPLLLLGPLSLVGCSGDDGDDEGNPFGVPDCADVRTIDEDYGGCEDAEGEIEAALGYDCDDGRGLILSGPVFGFVGEEAQEAGPEGNDSDEAQAAWSECHGYDVETPAPTEESGGDDPLDSAPSTVASCEETWVEGETLPIDYDGCGAPEAGEEYSMACDDGPALWTLEDPDGGDLFFARAGGVVTPADEGYDGAYAACAG